MTTVEHIKTLKRMDQLIGTKFTGTPEDFARRVGISVRSIYNYLALMKELGAPIRYSRPRESYVYTEDGSFIMEFEKKN